MSIPLAYCIAGREHAGYVCFKIIFRDDLVPIVETNSAFQTFGVWFVPDQNEHAVNFPFGDFVRQLILNPNTLQRFIAHELNDLRFHNEVDLGIIFRFVDGVLKSLKVIELMNDGHTAGVFRQRHSFFKRGVSTTHNYDLFILKEIAVTRCTIGNALTLECCFARYIERARLPSRRKNNRACRVQVFPIHLHRLDVSVQRRPGNSHVGLDDAAKFLRLVLHRVREIVAARTFDTGIVRDLMRQNHLSTGCAIR